MVAAIFVLVTFVKRPFVAKKCVVVTFVKFAEPPFNVVLLSVAIVPEEEINVVIFPVVAIKFVNVPVVAMTEPAETKFEKKLVEVALENVPFVAKMFVVVAVPRMAFQRSAEEPSERDASRDGIKFVEIFPLTAKFVVVTFVPVPLIQVRFVRFNVPAERLVNAPFVAKRLVEVTEVPVASVKVRPFNEEMPETEREPRDAPPDTERFVEEALFKFVCPMTVKVEVTVEDAAINPPKR